MKQEDGHHEKKKDANQFIRGKVLYFLWMLAVKCYCRFFFFFSVQASIHRSYVCRGHDVNFADIKNPSPALGVSHCGCIVSVQRWSMCVGGKVYFSSDIPPP